MGGASKAGLKLGGFSTTGVFVDSIIPGSEAEMKDLVQKGDQLLQINDTKIGKDSVCMAIINEQLGGGCNEISPPVNERYTSVPSLLRTFTYDDPFHMYPPTHPHTHTHTHTHTQHAALPFYRGSVAIPTLASWHYYKLILLMSFITISNYTVMIIVR